MSPHSGEGAVSTGPMVAVVDTRSVVEARAVVELLEAHAIPALVNLEIEGIVFPWQAPQKDGAARVLVPSTMLTNARDVLRRAVPPTRTRVPPPPPPPISTRPPMSDVVSTPPLFSQAPRVFQLPERLEAPDLDDAYDDTGPIELPLPEPSPLARRLAIAMFAIIAGIGAQRVLETLFAPAGVMARFAAKAPILEEPWRLVTASFMHVTLEHFLSNAAFGLLIGVVLFGTHYVGATMLVWLLSSMVGLFAEASLSATGALIAGASAGNYGLVGLWAKGQLDRSRVATLPRREQLRTLGILLLLVPGALTPVTSTGSRVAVLAHVAGFAAGLLLGVVFERRVVPEEMPRLRKRSRAALWITIVLVALGVGLAAASTAGLS
ncbi:rhomboid family intramembrane serine protease [Myxococcota bacterium]|nr:rhomboid family intramembrane serine protease [Myxococcota bacterium]